MQSPTKHRKKRMQAAIAAMSKGDTSSLESEETAIGWRRVSLEDIIFSKIVWRLINVDFPVVNKIGGCSFPENSTVFQNYIYESVL
jgi:hypothetical protein